MKKRNSGFIKISRNLFQSKELYKLKKEEKMQGIGTFMIIVMTLAKYEDAIGNDETLKILSVLTGKKKWYVWHIIKDFNLFNIDGEDFQCKLLQKTFNIETYIGEDDEPKDAKKTISSSNSSSEISSNSFSTLHNKVRPQAGAQLIQDTKYKIKENIGTGVPIKDTTTSTTDFHELIEDIFRSPDWLEKIEQRMALCICSNKMIREFVKRSFIDEIEMNGCYDDGEPFTISRAKRYFVNWIRPGKAPREELNKKINNMLRINIEQAKKKAGKPFDGYGTIDAQGRRRGPHGEIVPMDAPACMDDMMEWNNKTQCWE